MPLETAPTTRDDLVRLLTAKDETQRAFSAAAKAVRDAAEQRLTPAERVELDIQERAALSASCAADRAYADALEAFTAAQAEAA